MLEEISEIHGLDVYTPEGMFVGKADRYIIDLSNKAISGIFVNNGNPVLVDEGISIKIPFRWVQAIGDVIILKAFPKHVNKDGSIE